MFLDGQHFAKFVVTLAADVFVEGHRVVRFAVEGLVSFDEEIFLETLPYFPLPAKGSPSICAAQLWALFVRTYIVLDQRNGWVKSRG